MFLFSIYFPYPLSTFIIRYKYCRWFDRFSWHPLSVDQVCILYSSIMFYMMIYQPLYLNYEVRHFFKQFFQNNLVNKIIFDLLFDLKYLEVLPMFKLLNRRRLSFF